MNAVTENIKRLFAKDHKGPDISLSLLKYIGPGLLVTVGFIDPGNWATNIAAGADFGYGLLWVITLSTIMLILLQHNVAHLGIVTGDCLAEAATRHLKKKISIPVLITALLACASTALAELLGGAIALNMLFHIPVKAGSFIVFAAVTAMLFSNSYKKIEKIIIGFVSVIGLSFLYELTMVKIDWSAAAAGWVTPIFPENSAFIIMSVLGAVVMPHNLFLHSEIIQSRQFNLEDKSVLEKQLKYEFTDTLFSMIVGWAINSAMILLAAATFFQQHIAVDELSQAHTLLTPLIGNASAVIFAIALLFAGFSSSITAGMTGGSILAGMFGEPYSISDRHTRIGVLGTLIIAMAAILFIGDPFSGLLISQMLLSIQLPITIFLQLYLTSSQKVMGEYKNSPLHNTLLWAVGIAVTALNLYLLADTLL
ncbi:Nramp family divalent metal transporter [Caproiciproducens faecalis]|uniref:Nramp family divalent metal transporter n=1 Tax=Caproiciproducens faecalis TaxID=2820301 RepID=A0ABS7DLS4_9FIRM|nr:Nramp family divalent metal transporter [Caproiciproducens faecalis]MBW7572260.1 Nramp family divalent metal transporter [Caproiciproducens faecalis]